MLSDKKLARIEKALGNERIIELEALSEEQLKNQVVNSEHAINNAIKELEANPKFQELKENLKALSQGLREVKKFQGAIIQFSLSLLEDKGHGEGSK